jgi:hypothetical protein
LASRPSASMTITLSTTMGGCERNQQLEAHSFHSFVSEQRSLLFAFIEARIDPSNIALKHFLQLAVYSSTTRSRHDRVAQFPRIVTLCSVVETDLYFPLSESRKQWE